MSTTATPSVRQQSDCTAEPLSGEAPKFFLFDERRRPHLWKTKNPQGQKVEWDDQKTIQDGFLTEAFIKKENITVSASVVEDLKYLGEVLLPSFFAADHQARHYQDVYYRFQYWLIIGALITSLIGAFTVTSVASTAPPTSPAGVTPDLGGTVAAATAQLFTVDQSIWPKVFGFLVAIAGAITAAINGLDKRINAQQRWYSWRRTAEELRQQYYFYLAHLPPYHTKRRRKVLRHVTEELSLAGNDFAGDESMFQTDESEALADDVSMNDAEAILKLYRVQRIDNQCKFYRQRLAENKRNSDRIYAITLWTFIGASLLSAANSIFGAWPILTLMIAVLPVLAALIASFERVYGWERQLPLYDVTRRALARHRRLALEADEPEPGTNFVELLRTLITETETSLSAEGDQWGKSVLAEAPRSPAYPARTLIEESMSKLNLNATTQENIRKLIADDINAQRQQASGGKP
jgi:ABC-type multidrug transport system fused ATPase/permease subunit